ncbi:MAG: 30S ribosomal protein S9 [Bacteroidetes bacterium CG02_land_8_20_14_3_00_31_25]|nr:30S ribosomal protein S9 [Bacteroidota bacterium]PIV59844.1 MAG: 30S ribosomal protein S9 [Bacteroidetes bacterium CG02_land_8_20_14_3_00_31_25]PIX36560.1 MAG: 30S ribosomal protein S9 [Bacteroidetes bacterium CG_4_8_14_3_um_filter_31_14]PIY06147.1 MAG: 30S ribosomal protein S9 [Bacteroidetes bacterium CG_4_10_14_3_um_filter_31_20]
MGIVNTIGRRKAAIARIYLKEGSGIITINNREFKNYFTTEQLQNTVTNPLQTAQVENKFDIKVNLDGGGINGQAEALRLAISRALVKLNPEVKPALKVKGFLTRNPREVERKKPGQKKARKRFQFSKR